MTGKETIDNYVKAITRACGLHVNEVKTIIYYSVASHGILRIPIMPVLVLRGPQGTGKSTIMSLLKQIVNKPNIIDGNISKAALRDKLKFETTALIEEADSIDEDLMIKRYSRQTSSTVVKRGSTMAGFQDKELDIFGATVLHRRVPFKDAALDSRSIFIRTRYKPGEYSKQTLNSLELKLIADSINWNEPLGLPSGRVADAWEPLFQAAVHCGDGEWILYALEEVTKAADRLMAGQRYEPESALVFTLQNLFYENSLLTKPEPVGMSNIRQHLKEHYDITLKNYQIEEMVNHLGFRITRPHGYPTVKPDEQLLKKKLSEIQSDV